LQASNHYAQALKVRREDFVTVIWGLLGAMSKVSERLVAFDCMPWFGIKRWD
jgi:hypothetical protein